ncbi:IS630 family transposase [Actinosynnema sp. NPDC059797]
MDPQWSGGRSRAIGEATGERICLIARTAPADWGITAFSTWSLSKLRDHLLDRGAVAAVSRETLRRILRDGGVSWQATTTWKAFTDPDLLAKMHRILDLYDYPPDDGRVICVDEFGLLNLMPRKDKTWRPAGSPRQLRTTYNRHHGVMHMLAALDLTTGKIHYRIRRRKRHAEFLDLLKTLRTRGPDQRLHLVMDNFSPHRHPDIRQRAADNDAELVFLPTYSSRLNWIEAEFAALRFFALNGTDHLTHAEQNAAIASFIRWCNARSQPKTGFATDSSIRTWTRYPAKPA